LSNTGGVVGDKLGVEATATWQKARCKRYRTNQCYRI